MRTRFTWTVVAMAAIAALLSPSGAAAAPTGGSPVDIYIQFSTPDAYGVYNAGTFQATSPLCSFGTVTWEFPVQRLTCSDGTGTFDVYLMGSSSLNSSNRDRWSFRGGTGAYADIAGGGRDEITAGTCGYSPCTWHLWGTVSL